MSHECHTQPINQNNNPQHGGRLHHHKEKNSSQHFPVKKSCAQSLGGEGVLLTDFLLQGPKSTWMSIEKHLRNCMVRSRVNDIGC